MSATTTSISWTDRTWNPIRGCSLVSAGCTHCYAMRQAGRFNGAGQPYEGLVRKTTQGYKWTGEVRLIKKDLATPLRWKTPCRVFVNSMSDLFHDSVPDEWIDHIFAVMAVAQQHTFQILTKRPERMHAYFMQPRAMQTVAEDLALRCPFPGWPLPNVWLGVSIENQATADERIPWLLKTPAVVRFVSAEPLLGPVDLATDACNWCIIGGESGPKARPCEIAWIESLARQCEAAHIACWVKQLGSFPCGWSGVRNMKDRKGADPTEWPAALRIQQMP